MKIYKVSETATETAECPTSEDTLYLTNEVAKKHFDEKRASVLGNEVFAKHIMSSLESLDEFRELNNFRTVKCCSNCEWVSINGSYCCHPDSIFGEISYGGNNVGKRLCVSLGKGKVFVCDKWSKQK